MISSRACGPSWQSAARILKSAGLPASVALMWASSYSYTDQGPTPKRSDQVRTAVSRSAVTTQMWLTPEKTEVGTKTTLEDYQTKFKSVTMPPMERVMTQDLPLAPGVNLHAGEEARYRERTPRSRELL